MKLNLKKIVLDRLARSLKELTKIGQSFGIKGFNFSFIRSCFIALRNVIFKILSPAYFIDLHTKKGLASVFDQCSKLECKTRHLNIVSQTDF